MLLLLISLPSSPGDWPCRALPEDSKRGSATSPPPLCRWQHPRDGAGEVEPKSSPHSRWDRLNLPGTLPLRRRDKPRPSELPGELGAPGPKTFFTQ